MNRYAFLLSAAILTVVTVSAPAIVNIVWIDPDGYPGATVALGYRSTAGEKVVAFALDVQVDGGAVITNVDNFKVGVSTAASPGYGLFPANFARHITVNAQGDVDDWSVAGYTPVADARDKGALGGLGTSGVTLEFAGLWDGDANAPATSGTLCTLTLSKPANIAVTTNAIRGNVVLAGGVEATVSLPGPPVIPIPECFPLHDRAYSDWVIFGKPQCWCITTQCHGDADGLKEGSSKTGYWRVHFRDLNVLLAGWNVAEPSASGASGQGIANVLFTDGLGAVNGICADFAHDVEGSTKTGFFRVHFNDLNILIANWNVREPPQGPGLPKDCGGTLNPVP